MHVDDHRGDGPVQRGAGRGPAGSLDEQLAGLATALSGVDEPTQVVDSVVHAAAAALPGAEHASITQRDPAGVRTRVASSDVARRVDRLQYDAGEGPCLDALGTETSVRVTDLLADDRWPRFAQAAAAVGLRSSLSIRLQGPGDRAAALNLFSSRPEAFEDGTQPLGALLARHAALALTAADRVEQLQQAMATRDVIGQAKGLLMERHGLDADRAFAVLVRYSRDTNTRLRQVAESLVVTRSLPGPG